MSYHCSTPLWGPRDPPRGAEEGGTFETRGRPESGVLHRVRAHPPADGGAALTGVEAAERTSLCDSILDEIPQILR